MVRPRGGPAALAFVDLGPGQREGDGQAFTFEDADTLLLYTDGIIEARSPDGAFYPLAERVAPSTSSGPEALLHHIRADLLAHVGGQLNDDATAVAIQRSPKLDPGHQLKKIVDISSPDHAD
ncbi:SpoIIE family protein phosphatase [Streptomyces sp. NPDC017993]|uniref:SpoIIE family protein phosphatase n=1 Tax=Streptomyces sp. NPDC017993 TaxID=3365027 RepID=UPI0037BCC6F4